MKSFPLSLSGNASAMLLALGMTPLLLLREHCRYFRKLLRSTCSSVFWDLAQVTVLLYVATQAPHRNRATALPCWG